MVSLKYGTVYSIQNGYNAWNGGYLDTRGSGCQDNYLCVSTAESSNRTKSVSNPNGARTASWQILSAQNKQPGQPVVNGDVIYFLNMYKGSTGNGGYLDTRGSGCADNLLCVSTSADQDRPDTDGSTTKWRIIADSPSPEGQVQTDSLVHLLNGWNDWQGGFLDTRGSGCQDNYFCVSTTPTWQRDTGSTHWRFYEELSS